MMLAAGAAPGSKKLTAPEVRKALLHDQDIPGTVMLLICTGAGTWDLRLVPGHGVYRVRSEDDETIVEWEPFMALNSAERALDVASHYLEVLLEVQKDDVKKPWAVAALMLDRDANDLWFFPPEEDGGGSV